MLLDPCDLAPIGAVNSRVVMAAMTRGFAPEHLATADMAAYYGKRAEDGVGLILTAILNPEGIASGNVELWNNVIKPRLKGLVPAAPPESAADSEPDGTLEVANAVGG